MKEFLSDSQIDRFKSSWELQDHIIATQVKNFDSIELIKPGDLVLISLSDEVGAAIRYKWYGFSQFTSMRIVDCGTYKGNDLTQIQDFINLLWKKEAVVVLVSKNLDKGLYHRLHTNKENQIETSASITRYPSDTIRLYPNISFVSLATQVHRSKPEHLMKSNNMNVLRLGEMRSYFAESEPYVRHTDCCFFDFNSVRFADAPAQPNPSTSGLTSEECCHLAKYVGQASKLKLFWIYNFTPEDDVRGVTADLIAQMLWYFADGMEMRKDSYPLSKSALQTYVIEFDKLDIPLIFYKSTITDRWWVSATFEMVDRPFPCSIRDYELARQGELSQRLIELLDIYG